MKEEAGQVCSSPVQCIEYIRLSSMRCCPAQGLKSNGQCRCSRTVLSVYTHQDTHHMGNRTRAHHHILTCFESIFRDAGYHARTKNIPRIQIRHGKFIVGGTFVGNADVAGYQQLVLDVSLVHDFTGSAGRQRERQSSCDDLLLNPRGVHRSIRWNSLGAMQRVVFLDTAMPLTCSESSNTRASTSVPREPS